MLNQARIISFSQEQGELLPTYPSDLIAEDHHARVINDIIELMDLTVLYNQYGIEGGQAFHPKALLKILFYGYTEGTQSSRRLSKECCENYIYMFLGHRIKPNFRTISEFRRRNLDILKDMFNQIVVFCKKLGMIEIGNISLDGTKIKANASNNAIVRKDQLQKELRSIESEIESFFEEAEKIDRQEDQKFGPDNNGTPLPEQIKKARERKKQIQRLIDEMDQKGTEKQSLTDKDALFMKNHGRFELSYNAQCITENQIILACDVTDQRHDSDQFIPMLEKVAEIAKELTDKTENVLSGVQLNVDAGYDSNQNLAYLEQKNINGFVPNQKARHVKKAFNKDKFTYYPQEDFYECPAGNKLNLLKKVNKTKKGYFYTESYYQCQSCHHCDFQSQCVRSKTGLRLVVRNSSYERLRQQMDKKLLSTKGKTAIKRRATDVEPVFGHIKQVIYRNSGFLLRSKAKVQAEFTLAAIAHNLKKMAHYIKNMPTEQKLAEILA